MMMCKEATRLMSLKQDRRLTVRERLSLRLHLSMCGACRRCDRQFGLLHEAGGRRGDIAAGHDGHQEDRP